MVHARVSEAYIHFALMYTTYHIFPVLPIKDLINEDGDPTTPYKLATGTKPSVSYLRVLFRPYVVRKATAHAGTDYMGSKRSTYQVQDDRQILGKYHIRVRVRYQLPTAQT